LTFVQAQTLPGAVLAAAGGALIMSFNLGHKMGEANILAGAAG
jgi:hypothetical protein